MTNQGKHWVDEEAGKVLKKTNRSKSRHKVKKADEIFSQWFDWSSVFLVEFDLPDEKIQYFTITYIGSLREVQSSIILALHGSYKNAVQILRNWLELTVAGIYFDHHITEGKKWNEEKGFIHFTDFKKSLEQEKVLSKKTVSAITIKWQDLSQYVHSCAETLEGFSDDGYSMIAPSYNQKNFDDWFDFLRETYELCSVLLAEHIPEVLQSEKIEEFFEPTTLKQLKANSANK